VGFLASWWVGMAAGWFVARAGLAELPRPEQRIYMPRSFAILLTTCPIGGLAGALLGLILTRQCDPSEWVLLQHAFGLENVRAFVIVGCLHAGSYLGALAGLITAIMYVRKQVRRMRKLCNDAL
jgi:hypothetical protein